MDETDQGNQRRGFGYEWRKVAPLRAAWRALRGAGGRLTVLAVCAAATGVLAPQQARSADSAESAGASAEAPASSVFRLGDRSTVMKSRLEASPMRVYDAHTRPEQLQQWLDAPGREFVECEVDLRPGGAYRYVFRGAGGTDFVLYGEYREIVAGERVVRTEAYEGYDWEPLVVTTEFEPDGAGTALVVTILYPSEKIREADFPNIEQAVGIYPKLDAFLRSQ